MASNDNMKFCYTIHFLAENCYHYCTTLSFLCFIFVKVKLERNGTCMYAAYKYIQYEEGTAYMFISSSEISVEGKT